ncbi:MAG: hypothetical protein U0V74_14135 [Chitinophagales bacterium]
MIKTALLIITYFLSCAATKPVDDNSKLLEKAETYYGELMSNPKLSQKVRQYEDTARAISKGEVKAFYKKGKLVMLTNNYDDGEDCHETITYVIQDDVLLLVDYYRQCAFTVNNKTLQEYRQDKYYFKESRLALYLVREGEGEDNAEKIQFTGKEVTAEDEGRLLDNLAFWRRFIDSELNYRQFSKIRPYKF